MNLDDALKIFRYVAIGGAAFVFVVFCAIAIALPHCYEEDLASGKLVYFEANC
jgi:hypothetical protein